MIHLVASPAPKPRPPKDLGAKRSRNGWKQEPATVCLPSSGGETSAASTEHGEDSFQCVEGSCAVSGGGRLFGLVGILLG